MPTQSDFAFSSIFLLLILFNEVERSLHEIKTSYICYQMLMSKIQPHWNINSTINLHFTYE